MSRHAHQSRSTELGKAARIVQRVFRDYPGNLAVQLWDSGIVAIGSGAPDATLVFRKMELFRDLILLRDPLWLAEAYFQNEVDVEGNLYTILELREYLQNLRLSTSEKLSFFIYALTLGGLSAAQATLKRSLLLAPALWRGHTKRANRKAIAYHYDVSNAFYRLWLDEQMIYSCAYFNSTDNTLEQAQRNKLEHICRKLRLTPGERLLDIGCGWGALIRWAARHHGVHAHGITLSREQYEHNRAMISREGLQGQVSVELKDYRELTGEACYDKIVSVGMFEHVGLKNLPNYFAIARRLLAPGGLFLNHGITHDREGWGNTVETRFINRYVFPDGELDTVSNVQRVMERAGFEILDVEALRRHYALTLRHWVARLESRRDESLRLVPETIYRIWRLYMAASALEFEQGDLGVYQILTAGKGSDLAQVPMTRRDLYV